MRQILLICAFLYFLVAGGLLFKRSGKQTALLGVFILLFGLEIIYFIYGTSQIIYTYPQYSGFFYFLVGFLYGPVLFWHFKYHINNKESFNYWQLLHLIPMVVTLVYLRELLLMTGHERITFMNNNFTEFVMPINYARAIHLLCYGVLLVSILVKNQFNLSVKDKLYTWSITFIYFVSCVVISWFTLFANSWRDFGVYYLVASNIGIFIAVLLYIDPYFLQEITHKYLKSSISNNDKRRIVKKIEIAFSTNKVFLQNDMSLSKLGSIVEEKNHTISQTFSEELKTSFQSYLNRHRIEHAKGLLIESKNKKYTIEAIGQQSGFNNRVSFNKAFKQFTSQTPSEFRKSHTIL